MTKKVCKLLLIYLVFAFGFDFISSIIGYQDNLTFYFREVLFDWGTLYNLSILLVTALICLFIFKRFKRMNYISITANILIFAVVFAFFNYSFVIGMELYFEANIPSYKNLSIYIPNGIQRGFLFQLLYLFSKSK